MNEVQHLELTNRRKLRVGAERCRVWSLYNRGPNTVLVTSNTVTHSVDTYPVAPGCIKGFYTRPTVQLLDSGSASITIVSYDTEEK